MTTSLGGLRGTPDVLTDVRGLRRRILQRHLDRAFWRCVRDWRACAGVIADLDDILRELEGKRPL